MKTLALQMSDAYPSEGFTEWLLSRAEGADILDLRGVEGTCCYCDGTAKEEIGKALPAVLPRLRWIDGGDYHYLTHLLALREKEPFWMVLMDNHPDNQEPAFDGVLSCGSWVKAMEEENGMLRGVLTIGPEGCMQELPEGWADGKRVYISLDKDIMSPECARTDWTQGEYTLGQIEDMLLRIFKSAGEIVAVDICGELQPSKGGKPEDLRINLETNTELYNYITKHLN